MKRNKSLAVFSVMLCLVCLFSAPQARINGETRTDTFSVEMPRDTFYSAFKHWRTKVNARELPCTIPECDTSPIYYSTGMLRTGLFAKSVVIDTSHLKIYLTHVWSRGNRTPALYRIPNVTYTLKQELGVANNDGMSVPEKSYWAFLGITLLNSGAGMIYASYKSPFSSVNYFEDIVYGIMDAVFTVGLFTDNSRFRMFSEFMLPAAKLGVGLRVIFIHEHNKYVRTGYKFILGK
jgi:hypothetical protein